MLPTFALEEYVAEDGTSPFKKWFDGLSATEAAIVTISLERLRHRNTSNVKTLGGGVSELRIDRGPGYRIYFGWDGPTLVILLAGGTKRRQQRDIEAAKLRRKRYRLEKGK